MWQSGKYGRHHHLSQIGVFCFCLLTVPTQAAALKLCFEDAPQHPWTMPDGKGLNFVLLKAVADRLGEQFEYKALPWKRCMAYAESGEMDAVIGAANSPERRLFARVALSANGQDRIETSLNSDNFNVYVRNDSNIGWNGKSFQNLSGSVAIQAGFVVAAPLRAMGLEVDQSGKSAEHALRLLEAGNPKVAVLQGTHANLLLHGDQRFRGKIKVLPIPFASVPLYLMASKKSYATQADRFEKIWAAIALERESEAYKNQEKAALGLGK
jgi:polar amino acid transport system substrate-binding protein